MKPSKWMAPIDRLMMRVNKTEECWLWTGRVEPDGYGRICINGKNTTCQRAAYILMVGDIPEGFEIHHECLNRLCVNPEHLIAVTKEHHLAVLHDLGLRNRSKTHCRNGHEYTPENTSIIKDGSRSCRECGRESHRQWLRRNAEHVKAYRDAHKPPPAPVSPPLTHCKNGHEFNSENTYHHPSGTRVCRECMKSHTSAYYLRNRENAKVRRDARRKAQRERGEKVT